MNARSHLTLAEGRTLAQLALQFVIAHPAITADIPGAKTPKQLRDNVGAALLPPLTAEESAQIDAITLPGGGRKIWKRTTPSAIGASATNPAFTSITIRSATTPSGAPLPRRCGRLTPTSC